MQATQAQTAALQVTAADMKAQIAPGGEAYRALGLAGAKASDAPAARPGVRGGGDSDGLGPNGFYPADVSNPAHNPAVVTAQHHPIYINNVPSHWGDPGTFLTDLGNSDFVHILDQYVGRSNDRRYTLGTSFLLPSYPIPANHTLQYSDLASIAHVAASIKGGGLGHIYHLFLPKGVDTCLTAGDCYSPDVPSTFAFCGYHSAVTFTDAVGTVIFTAEPYQDVLGCSVPPTGKANSQLVDSTNNVLSHEVFETISDPTLNCHQSS